MAHKPDNSTRKKVESLCAVGIPQEDIALVLGIDAKTLRKHYRKELDEAMTKANAAVAGKLYSSAMAGDVRAQIFWCKTRLGWRETNNMEISGPDGSAIKTDNKITIEFIDSTSNIDESKTN